MGWITLHAHHDGAAPVGDEEEEGTVHVFISEGPADHAPKGVITRGPRSLLGADISHLAKHARVEHHPKGHEPKSARAHPDFATHEPTKKVHVYGRHGPGTGYDVEVSNPIPHLSEEEAKAGLDTARAALKGGTPAPATTPSAPAAPAYQAHPDDAPLLAQMAAHQGRHTELGGIAAASSTYGNANRHAIQNLQDEQGDQRVKHDRAQHQLANQQYARMGLRARASLAPHLNAKGEIDARTAGHADAGEVNDILATFHRLPKERQGGMLGAIEKLAGHTDPLADNAPLFAPLSYAMAAHHIAQERPNAAPEPIGIAARATAPSDLQALPEGPLQHASAGTLQKLRRHTVTRGTGPDASVLHIVEDAPERNRYHVAHDVVGPDGRRPHYYGRDLSLKAAKAHAARLLGGAVGTHEGRLVFPEGFGTEPAAATTASTDDRDPRILDMAKVLAKHDGITVDEAYAKIARRPGGWTGHIQGIQDRAKADAAEKRREQWKPTPAMQDVLDMVKAAPVHYPAADGPMSGHHRAATQALITRGLLKRTEINHRVHYAITAPVVPDGGTEPVQAAPPVDSTRDERGRPYAAMTPEGLERAHRTLTAAVAGTKEPFSEATKARHAHIRALQMQDSLRTGALLKEAGTKLAPLQGSDKQIKWAEEIRAEHLGKLAEHTASAERRNAAAKAMSNADFEQHVLSTRPPGTTRAAEEARHADAVDLAHRTLHHLAALRGSAHEWIDQRHYTPADHLPEQLQREARAKEQAKAADARAILETANAQHEAKGKELLAGMGTPGPITEGSPRQQVWAERDIKPAHLTAMATHVARLQAEQHPDAALAERVLKHMHGTKYPAASFWIDRKDRTPTAWLEAGRPKPTPEEAPQTPAPTAPKQEAPAPSREELLDHAYHRGARAAEAEHGAETRPLDRQIHGMAAMLRQAGVPDITPMDVYRQYNHPQVLPGSDGVTPQSMRTGLERMVQQAVEEHQRNRSYDTGAPSFYSHTTRAEGSGDTEADAKQLFTTGYKHEAPDQRVGSKHYNDAWKRNGDLARSTAHREAADRHQREIDRIERDRKSDEGGTRAEATASRFEQLASHLAALTPASPQVAAAQAAATEARARAVAHQSAYDRALAELRTGAAHHTAEADRFQAQHAAAKAARIQEQATAAPPAPRADAVHTRDAQTGRSWLNFHGHPTDAQIADLKRDGWRWSGYRKEWHNPRKYVAAPASITTEDGGKNQYSSERADRLEARAGKARHEADVQYEKSNAAVDAIPMGQPILRGHHSQHRHERALERSRTALDKTVAATHEAARLEQQAKNSRHVQAQREHAPTIQRRIERLEADRRSITEGVNKWRDSPERAERLAHIDAELAEHKQSLADAGGLPNYHMQVAPGDHLKVGGHVIKVTGSGPKSIMGLIQAPGTNLHNWQTTIKREDLTHDAEIVKRAGDIGDADPTVMRKQLQAEVAAHQAQVKHHEAEAARHERKEGPPPEGQYPNRYFAAQHHKQEALTHKRAIRELNASLKAIPTAPTKASELPQPAPFTIDPYGALLRHCTELDAAVAQAATALASHPTGTVVFREASAAYVAARDRRDALRRRLAHAHT